MKTKNRKRRNKYRREKRCSNCFYCEVKIFDFSGLMVKFYYCNKHDEWLGSKEIYNRRCFAWRPNSMKLDDFMKN